MAETYTRKGFVKKYGSDIAKAVKGTGILAGTLVAQAIVESQGKVASGSYRVGASTLSQEANNYFGIKCYGGWKGKTYNIDTGEQKPDGSRYVDKNACFRKYDSVKDSMKDYLKFLKENPRYEKAGVFKAKSVKEQAEVLKRGGYATSVKYADTINKVYLGVKEEVDKYAKPKTDIGKIIVFSIVGLSVIGVGIGLYHYFKTKNK
tara:strand:+ start:935 stop:1549 length:615 start_codon:yes stop_codon:yes gene_type:complete